jgi:hypothetical protein
VCVCVCLSLSLSLSRAAAAPTSSIDRSIIGSLALRRLPPHIYTPQTTTPTHTTPTHHTGGGGYGGGPYYQNEGGGRGTTANVPVVEATPVAEAVPVASAASGGYVPPTYAASYDRPPPISPYASEVAATATTTAQPAYTASGGYQSSSSSYQQQQPSQHRPPLPLEPYPMPGQPQRPGQLQQAGMMGGQGQGQQQQQPVPVQVQPGGAPMSSEQVREGREGGEEVRARVEGGEGYSLRVSVYCIHRLHAPGDQASLGVSVCIFRMRQGIKPGGHYHDHHHRRHFSAQTPVSRTNRDHNHNHKSPQLVMVQVNPRQPFPCQCPHCAALVTTDVNYVANGCVDRWRTWETKGADGWMDEWFGWMV